MVHLHAFSCPSSFRDSLARFVTNLGHFRINYAITVLIIVFLSFFWHPISLIVFVVRIVAWFFLYFLRDEPLVIFGRTIDDRSILITLSITTIIVLLLTDVTRNLVVSLAIGLAIIVLHGLLRKTDDLVMSNYGAIPTSAGESSGLGFLSRAKERGRSILATRRPWREMVHLHALGIPSGFRDALARFRRNLGYFRVNYAIIVLIIVFLSLLWHPISLIVFLAMFVLWFFLYFFRDEPLVIFGRTIDDRIILITLSIITIIVLLLTHVTLNVVVSLAIGLAIIVLHGVFRKTDDLFVHEEETASLSPQPVV
ncbi:PRA1 family protein F2 [Nymphaea thermarum]|nr:PRA1 family protein F2 [Nymphaea thermarum]